MTGDADLADHDHVVRRPQLVRHGGGDGNAAARQADDHDLTAFAARLQRGADQGAELPAGVLAIREHALHRAAHGHRCATAERHTCQTNNPASTLIVEAMIAVPNRYDSAECRSRARRIARSVISVSDT